MAWNGDRMRILLVEDDRVIAGAVREQAESEGHSVDHADRLDVAGDALSVAHFDLILLDLMLPDGRGLPFLRSLRARGDRTPVIIMTALDQVSDRIEGLNAGADDYLVKPFDLSELSARIGAVSRRYAGNPNPRIELGALSVDIAARSLTRAGKPVPLTARDGCCLRPSFKSRGSCCPSRCWKSGSIPSTARSKATRSRSTSAACARSWGPS